ncbi:MAG: hypothetical protein V8S31_11685 [Lachnospiraceae bacterium]
MLATAKADMHDQEAYRITDIMRSGLNMPVNIDETMDQLLLRHRSELCPVVDEGPLDGDHYKKDVIKYFHDQREKEK